MMKRSLGSSDSLGARISICPSTGTDPSPTEEHSPGSGSKHVYSSREWRLDDDDEEGAMEEVREKKRRLSVEQVRALEKHFEVENKLEPERKTKLAQELGLQPRQVAVWFQNRRARWKTKQLEKDYGALKSSFDSLQHDFHSLHQQNESLKQQIRDLKSTTAPVKEEHEAPVATTDSDSSAVLNSPNHHTHRLTYFNLSESAAGGGDEVPFVKMEEHDFLGEEGCNFFPEDEAPSLHWYCSPDDQWTS